ncbi:lactate/malate dehydrogenase family protein [Sulfuracidifex tepidarius]|uniref:Malate dehydrogenase n=1 Tax=Sulfuracidifex tepidarius TaxID=1294262 RepID=A0A510E5A5_9CREN|nr:lactate/malate dehydrogenase family protein [Sulfuracidifex tepidarius]BBG24928.1 Malate dehydrogenase [Sulfuracidifex tepidarius]BBG27712.1 Malate dehydrogenase [Sulfuracidifex tepidarius]
MTKIGFIGTGKIGQTIAFNTLMGGYVDEAVLYDIIPDLPEKFEHELRHALASRRLKTEVLGTNSLDDVTSCDVVVVTAGKPRKPGMDRRDLFVENAKIIASLAKELPKRNDAIYVMVSNPVDMMASIFMKVSGKYTISTGDQVETMRMRSFIAKKLKVPVNYVNGYVGGEHGDDAVILWSTVTVKDQLVGDKVDKEEVERYVKSIPGDIIKAMGGTTWGPGTIIEEIIRSIVLNENKVMSIAFPHYFEDEIVHISEPVVVGRKIGPSLESLLDEKDRWHLISATKDFYSFYKESLNRIQILA